MKNFLLIAFTFLVCSATFGQGKHEYKNKGFFNLSGINYYEVSRLTEDFLENGSGNTVYDYQPGLTRGVGFQTINGWFLGPYISMGIGLGIDFYNKQSLSIVPVFYDLRIYFSNNYNSFFLFGDIGSIISKKQTNYSTRALFTAGLGYKFFIGNKNCFESFIALDGKSFTKDGYDQPNTVHAFTVNSIEVGVSYLF